MRAESFIRPKLFQNGIINGVQESRQHQETYVSLDCTPDPTLGEALQETDEPSSSSSNIDETEDILHQLTSKHYYRYVEKVIRNFPNAFICLCVCLCIRRQLPPTSCPHRLLMIMIYVQ